MKPTWTKKWSKKRHKDQKKWYIAYFAASVIFFVFIGIIVKQSQPAMPSNSQKTTISESQHNELKEFSVKTSESRNEFTGRIASNPQEIDWTGEVVFLKVIQFLENPKTNIVQLFDEKINQLESEEYYAGAYYLQDHLYCELIWISNNNQLSLGFKISGGAQDIKNLENSIEATLKKTSTGTYQGNHYRKGWYDKVYNNMKYDIEYDHDTQDDQSTLTMNIHPHIYH